MTVKASLKRNYTRALRRGQSTLAVQVSPLHTRGLPCPGRFDSAGRGTPS